MMKNGGLRALLGGGGLDGSGEAKALGVWMKRLLSKSTSMATSERFRILQRVEGDWEMLGGTMGGNVRVALGSLLATDLGEQELCFI